MTQPQVAAEIKKLLPNSKVDKGRVYDWERGAHFPNDRYKGPIAEVLKVEDRGGFGYFLLEAVEPPAETPDLTRAFNGDSDQLGEILERIDRIDATLTKLFSGSALVAATKKDIDQARRQLRGDNPPAAA